MERILTTEQKNKKDKRNQLIISIVLIGIMLFSTLAYALNMENENQKENKIKYKDVEFLRNGEYWEFASNNLDFITKFNPYDTENISFNSKILMNSYSDQPLYFSGDFIDGHREIAINLDKRIVLRTAMACFADENCTENYPIKNCDEDNIIIFKNIKENEKESIYKTGKCVFITTSDVNQTLYADKFLFKLLGLN